MGTYNHSDKSTNNLLRGLRGLMSTVISRVISTMNLQVQALNPKSQRHLLLQPAQELLQFWAPCALGLGL